MKTPLITLLTDFGLKDHYVGAMKGVMLGICPDAQLVDISHEVAAYSITEGAYTLAQAWRCFPEGTVHLVVVDPGVGSARRPIIAEAAGYWFVAPDNGVLTMVYDAVPEHEVREITASRFFRHPVSQTFHGRDIFSPVAAYLARGVGTADFGPVLQDYRRLGFSKPVQIGPKSWRGRVLKVDWFGNVITNFESEEWRRLGSEAFVLRLGETCVSRVAVNYAGKEAGRLYVIAGSSGYLEISRSQGSAAETVGVKAGDAVELDVG